MASSQKKYTSVVTISVQDGSCKIVHQPELSVLQQTSVQCLPEHNPQVDVVEQNVSTHKQNTVNYVELSAQRAKQAGQARRVKQITPLQCLPEVVFKHNSEVCVVEQNGSSHQQKIKVEDRSVACGSSSQQANIRGFGRKCAASFCVGSRASMHTFPLIYKKKALIADQVSRCESWVAFCQNDLLQGVPLSALNTKFFICSNHFHTNQYYHKDRKTLLPNAIPEYKCDDERQHLNVTKRNNNLVSTDTQSGCDNRSIDITEPNNFDVDVIADTERNHMSQDERIDFERNNEEYTNNENSNNGNASVRNTKKSGRSCAAVSCQNTHSLHAFPRTKVNGVEDENKLQIVKIWIQKCANLRLLEIATSLLYSKFYLCSDHFNNDCFFDCSTKTLLVPNAVPTIFNNPQLSDADLQQFPVRTIDEIMFTGTLEDMLYDVFQKNFEDTMDGLIWETCDNCKESFLKKKKAVDLKCLHKQHCHLYTDNNNMDPGAVPPELENLTYVEQQLISRIHTNLSVRRVANRGGNQLKYTGNIINFPQDVSSIAKTLPHKINDLPIITVRLQKEDDHKDFYVNAKRVKDALVFLKCHNKYYKDIIISEENLGQLPENESVYRQLKGFDSSENEMCDESGNKSADECCEESVDSDLEVDDITNTFVPGIIVPNQDEQVKHILNWPTIDSTPINEFKHEGYMIMAFPCLFPWGKAGLRCKRKTKVQPKEYFKHLLRYHDRRFAQHPSFRFFAMNSIMRWDSLNDGHAFVKKNSEFAKLNNEELKEKISSNPNLLKKIMFQGKTIRGSKLFWKCRQNELRAMVDQIGLPSLFFTLSAADLHWPDLYRILIGPDRDVQSLTEWERRKLLVDNPIIVDTFFTMRVEAFMEEVLTPKFKVTDHWFRVEYQHRGSPHIHGVMWLKDAPDVANVTDINGPEAQKVLKFYDNLISTINPGQDIPVADKHPCRIRLKDVENHSVGLAQLLNKVQRHTIHSKGYCWRYNRKKKKEECRFDFPKALESDSKLEYDDNGFLVFISKRNDILLNRYNGYIITTWRANIDISPVISKEALIAYLSKYITKSEQKSKDFVEICNLILSNAKNQDSALKTIQKMLIKLCSDRDISAQEVGHYVMGLKYYSAGERQFVVVNMNSMNEVVVSGTSKVQKSILVKYLERPQKLNKESLWEVAKYYRLPSGSKRTNQSAIVMVYPIVHESPVMEDNDDFYKYSVLLHVPWRKLEEFTKDGLSWKQHFENFNVAKKLKNKVINESDLLAASNNDDNSMSDDESEDSSLLLPREDWMNIGAMLPNEMPEETDLGFREIDLNYNWNESFENYKQYGIQYLQTFIKQKKESEETSTTRCEFSFLNIKFTIEQQKVLNLLNEQIVHVSNENNFSNGNFKKRTIVQGKAGTGKSLLIHKMVAVIEEKFGSDSVLLLAPTGMAALNINGSTIHSKLIISSKNVNGFLKSKSERKLQEVLEKVRFVIIDEYSMLGSGILNCVDRRLRQGTGNLDQPFGNLPIYLFGDAKQLPPVGDTAFYKVLPGNPVKVLLDSFESAIILSQVKRQADSSFVDILDNIGNGAIELKDYHILETRFRSTLKEKAEEFNDTTYIFSKNAEVKKFNWKKLRELKCSSGNPVPIARIPAAHNCSEAKRASSDKANGLEPVLYLGKGCRVMLRHNLWTEKGLVNGACGKIIDIVYEEGKSSPNDIPAVLICTFDNYQGPYLDNDLKSVPIPVISKGWNGVTDKCIRSQFPVDQAYAITIHKSQGISLDKVRVNIGKSEFQLGITYVALSRARSLEGLLIDDFDFERLLVVNGHSHMECRRSFEEELKSKAL